MDKYDEKAAALLPCFCYKHIEPFREHHATCPAWFRPAVAEALRAAASNTYEAKEWAVASDEYEREIAALKAQLKDWEDNTYNKNDVAWITAQAEIAALRKERDDAAQQQRERDAKIARQIGNEATGYTVANAILADKGVLASL